jgi:hypothetical protein
VSDGREERLAVHEGRRDVEKEAPVRLPTPDKTSRPLLALRTVAPASLMRSSTRSRLSTSSLAMSAAVPSSFPVEESPAMRRVVNINLATISSSQKISCVFVSSP